MPNTTTNYSLYKPLVNDATDEDLWGGYINDSMDLIDTQMKTNADAAAIAVIGPLIYPVGSIYINKSVSTNPATLLGFGTWTAITDKFIVARGSTYTSTGGAATDSITISQANLPTSLTLTSPGTNTGDLNNTASGAVQIAGVDTGSRGTRTLTVNVGSGTAISVDTIPPYQAMYVWERTA